MCGKNSLFSVVVKVLPGSPPRVREKLLQRLNQSLSERITPACAGKAISTLAPMALARDHPRVCGKSFGSHVGIKTTSGSPPRVREKRFITVINRLKAGITPACAGKALSVISIALPAWDHPRVCGKSPFSVLIVSIALGSPPRVREKHTILAKSSPAHGITPACAGKAKPQVLK